MPKTRRRQRRRYQAFRITFQQMILVVTLIASTLKVLLGGEASLVRMQLHELNLRATL